MSTRSLTRSQSPGTRASIARDLLNLSASPRDALRLIDSLVAGRGRGPWARSDRSSLGSPRRLERKLEELFELEGVDRLGHVVVKAGIAREAPVPILSVAGQGYEDRVLQ